MDKDRFDAFMKLADFTRQIRENRQKVEWRMSFALWALIGTSVITMHYQHRNLMIIGGIVSLLFHIFWVGWNYLAADKDANRMYDFAYLAESEICLHAPRYKSASPVFKINILRHPPAVIQVSITILLIATAYVVISVNDTEQRTTSVHQSNSSSPQVK